MPKIDQYKYFERINYQPLNWQHLFHRSEARFRIPVCGRRTGKSHGAGRDQEPKLLIPKQRRWIVGPTYDLGEKEFRVIWDDMIVYLKMGLDKRIKKAYNKKSGDMYIEFPWQTRLEVRSADHPENLVGEALDGVIMSEAAKQKQGTWERMIRPALADKRGDAIFPTTPEGFNWLYDLWSYGQDPEMVDYESWNFPSWMNEIVYPGGREDPEIILLERTLTSAFFMQEIGAEFGAFVGKIFSEWSDKTHIRKHVFNPLWPNYMGIDWGWTRPAAFVEFQVSPWDTVHVWREHYKEFMTLEEHIQFLKERENPPGYHLEMCFGDAAEPQSAAYVAQHFRPCVADPEAKKDRTTGYELLGRFLKMRPAGIRFPDTDSPVSPVTPHSSPADTMSFSADGLWVPNGDEIDEFGTPYEEPGLFVDPGCKNIIREFNNLRAPEKGALGNHAVELATKSEDHALDALRYGVMHVFHLGANAHLADVITDGTTGAVVSPMQRMGDPAPSTDPEVSRAPASPAYEGDMNAFYQPLDGSDQTYFTMKDRF
jgi:hypothetical protein